ncbi:hypothetical protein TSUD_329440 [Trifolium subterraneum]|uniref:Uncharacterized protein n=1 Tax=Trifolium subterraneum TaxID=3900 RepID=A0A2Z6NGR7_TRISU|nr:hypothetical protein TSUD_329440 [Trifolium subterraneum]
MYPVLKCVKGNWGSSATTSSRRERERTQQHQLEQRIQHEPVVDEWEEEAQAEDENMVDVGGKKESKIISPEFT